MIESIKKELEEKGIFRGEFSSEIVDIKVKIEKEVEKTEGIPDVTYYKAWIRLNDMESELRANEKEFNKFLGKLQRDIEVYKLKRVV